MYDLHDNAYRWYMYSEKYYEYLLIQKVIMSTYNILWVHTELIIMMDISQLFTNHCISVLPVWLNVS